MTQNAWRRKLVGNIHRLWNVTGFFIRWPCAWNYGTLSRIYQIHFKAVLIMVIEAVVAKWINMTNACIHDLMVQCSYCPELQPCTSCLWKRSHTFVLTFRVSNHWKFIKLLYFFLQTSAHVHLHAWMFVYVFTPDISSLLLCHLVKFCTTAHVNFTVEGHVACIWEKCFCANN